jgi:hypothetical protein
VPVYTGKGASLIFMFVRTIREWFVHTFEMKENPSGWLLSVSNVVNIYSRLLCCHYPPTKSPQSITRWTHKNCKSDGREEIKTKCDVCKQWSG